MIPILTKDDAGNIITQEPFESPKSEGTTATPSAPAAVPNPGDVIPTTGGTVYVTAVGSPSTPYIVPPTQKSQTPVTDYAGSMDIDRPTYADTPGVTKGVSVTEAKDAGNSPGATTVLFKNTAPPTPVFQRPSHPLTPMQDVQSSLNVVWIPEDTDTQDDYYSENYQLARSGGTVAWITQSGLKTVVSYSTTPPTVLGENLAGIVDIQKLRSQVPLPQNEPSGTPATNNAEASSLSPALVIAAVLIAGFFALKGGS